MRLISTLTSSKLSNIIKGTRTIVMIMMTTSVIVRADGAAPLTTGRVEGGWVGENTGY